VAALRAVHPRHCQSRTAASEGKAYGEDGRESQEAKGCEKVGALVGKGGVIMALSDEGLASVKSASDDGLVRGAGTMDLAVVVEANLRLKRATSRLTLVLIILTVALVVIGGISIFPTIKGWFG
jgi:hypothetical protein